MMIEYLAYGVLAYCIIPAREENVELSINSFRYPVSYRYRLHIGYRLSIS